MILSLRSNVIALCFFLLTLALMLNSTVEAQDKAGRNPRLYLNFLCAINYVYYGAGQSLAYAAEGSVALKKCAHPSSRASHLVIPWSSECPTQFPEISPIEIGTEFASFGPFAGKKMRISIVGVVPNQMTQSKELQICHIAGSVDRSGIDLPFDNGHQISFHALTTAQANNPFVCNSLSVKMGQGFILGGSAAGYLDQDSLTLYCSYAIDPYKRYES